MICFMSGGEKVNRDTVRQIANVLATLATITVNGLANALPLNNLTTGEISDRFVVYFTPAGYVFSIWGLIYLALLAFTIYQALPGQRENGAVRRIGYLYFLASAANVAWIFLWHYEVFVPTLVAMVALLGALIAIYVRLDIGRVEVSPGDRWFIHLPFSIYLGWITVATVANVTAVLDYVGWSGSGISPEVWTAVVLTVATIIAVIMSLTRADVAYLLVLAWAFVGIYVKHSGTPVVAISAIAAAGLAALMAVVSALPRGPLPLASKKSA
jgi:hypothetical protein